MQAATATERQPDLTLAQVAGRLNISNVTLYRMLANGMGPPSYKLGQRRLFPADAFEQWLAERRQAAS